MVKHRDRGWKLTENRATVLTRVSPPPHQHRTPFQCRRRYSQLDNHRFNGALKHSGRNHCVNQKVVNAGIGNEVEWDPPEVELTRQKRARQPAADPYADKAGSAIPPDVNSSKVRPTRPKRVRFAPRYMNEYYLFD